MGWRHFNSELPYLMSPFRHTSHTPTLVREKYTHSQAIHIQYAESNPPTVHTHCPANTHTYWHSSSNTETHWHITEHKQNCVLTNTPGVISHPAGAPRYPTQFTHFPAMAWRIIAWGEGRGGEQRVRKWLTKITCDYGSRIHRKETKPLADPSLIPSLL